MFWNDSWCSENCVQCTTCLTHLEGSTTSWVWLRGRWVYEWHPSYVLLQKEVAIAALLAGMTYKEQIGLFSPEGFLLETKRLNNSYFLKWLSWLASQDLQAPETQHVQTFLIPPCYLDHSRLPLFSQPLTLQTLGSSLSCPFPSTLDKSCQSHFWKLSWMFPPCSLLIMTCPLSDLHHYGLRRILLMGLVTFCLNHFWFMVYILVSFLSSSMKIESYWFFFFYFLLKIF